MNLIPYFDIVFREMLSLGYIKRIDYSKLSPDYKGVYRWEIGILFIEISWGKIPTISPRNKQINKQP